MPPKRHSIFASFAEILKIVSLCREEYTYPPSGHLSTEFEWLGLVSENWIRALLKHSHEIPPLAALLFYGSIVLRGGLAELDVAIRVEVEHRLEIVVHIQLMERLVHGPALRTCKVYSVPLLFGSLPLVVSNNQCTSSVANEIKLMGVDVAGGRVDVDNVSNLVRIVQYYAFLSVTVQHGQHLLAIDIAHSEVHDIRLVELSRSAPNELAIPVEDGGPVPCLIGSDGTIGRWFRRQKPVSITQSVGIVYYYVPPRRFQISSLR